MVLFVIVQIVKNGLVDDQSAMGVRFREQAFISLRAVIITGRSSIAQTLEPVNNDNGLIVCCGLVGEAPQRQTGGRSEIQSFSGAADGKIRVKFSIRAVFIRAKNNHPLTRGERDRRKPPLEQVVTVVREIKAVQIAGLTAHVAQLDPVGKIAVCIQQTALICRHKLSNLDRGLGHAQTGKEGLMTGTAVFITGTCLKALFIAAVRLPGKGLVTFQSRKCKSVCRLPLRIAELQRTAVGQRKR